MFPIRVEKPQARYPHQSIPAAVDEVSILSFSQWGPSFARGVDGVCFIYRSRATIPKLQQDMDYEANQVSLPSGTISIYEKAGTALATSISK